MNNIRQIIEERLENARNDIKECLSENKVRELVGTAQAYQDCLNLIDEYTPKIVTKQLSVKEIETLLQDLNKPHQFIIDKPAPRTEQEILNDFEKLGYKVDFSLKWLIEMGKYNEEYSINEFIAINLEDHSYEKYLSGGEAINITIQEHKLLNELFICWGGWL